MGVKRAKIYSAFLCLILIFSLFISPVRTDAATVRTIPVSFLEDNKNIQSLQFSVATFDSYEFHGVNGMFTTGSNGTIVLSIPANKEGAFSYTDFLDVYFKNVGEIGGRKLNAQIHYDSVVVQKPYYTTARGYTNADDLIVMGLCGSYYQSSYSTSSTLLKASKDLPGFDTGRWQYCANETLKTTFTITYADTGEVADVPFFQLVYDLDMHSSNYTESFEGNSGYQDTIFSYEGSILTID